MALKRAPAVNTLRTVLQSLDAEALERAFRHHARDLLSVVEADGRPVIALDGKTRDCQKFRARLGMMGAKEPAHAETQRTSYS